MQRCCEDTGELGIIWLQGCLGCPRTALLETKKVVLPEQPAFVISNKGYRQQPHLLGMWYHTEVPSIGSEMLRNP